MSEPASATGSWPRAADIAAPPYGKRSLADLVPAVLASIGTPGFDDVVGLPPAQAACVLLVDGLGDQLLRAHPDDAPALNEALRPALSAGFPSTTAASIASVGTGRPPGRHGIVGYQVAVPGSTTLLNSLRWHASVDPLAWQPLPTAFERAESAGTLVTQVTKRVFKDGGLSRAVLRGGAYLGSDTFGEVAAGVLTALQPRADRDGRAAGEPAFVYAYVADLDATGHTRGVDSLAWRLQLQLIDRLVEQIASRLVAGTRLYVTADHGMVDVPPDRRIDLDVETALREGVRLVGGEPRARYLYLRPGARDDVLAAWRERLGDEACVCNRDEAIDAGWFGDVDDRVRERIGDIVAVSLTDLAIVASKAEPNESRLIGHHGSVTPAERLVPLAVFGG